MKSLTSSAFRLLFTSLTEETEVTVHGRVVGHYLPTVAAGRVRKSTADEEMVYTAPPADKPKRPRGRPRKNLVVE